MVLILFGSLSSNVIAENHRLRGTHLSQSEFESEPYPAQLNQNAIRVRVSKEFINRKLSELSEVLTPDYLNSLIQEYCAKGQVIATENRDDYGYSVTLGDILINEMRATALYNASNIDVDVEMYSDAPYPSFWIEVLVEGYVKFLGMKFPTPTLPIWIYLTDGHVKFSLDPDEGYVRHSNFDLNLSKLSDDLFSKGFGYENFWNSVPMGFGNLVFGGLPQLAYASARDLIAELMQAKIPNKARDKLDSVTDSVLREVKGNAFKRQAFKFRFDKAGFDLDINLGIEVEKLELEDDAIYVSLAAGVGGAGDLQPPPLVCVSPPEELWDIDADISIHASPILLNQLGYQIWQSGQGKFRFSSDRAPFDRVHFSMVSAFDGNSTLVGAPSFEDCDSSYTIQANDVATVATFDAMGMEIPMVGTNGGQLFAIPIYVNGMLKLILEGLLHLTLKLQDPDPKSFVGQYVMNFFKKEFEPEMNRALAGYELLSVDIPDLTFELMNTTTILEFSDMHFKPPMINITINEVR